MFKFYFSLFTIKTTDIFAMPNKKVDDLWHTYLLYTREYREFCNKCFNRFIDHIPDNSIFTKNNSEIIDDQIGNTILGLGYIVETYGFYDFVAEDLFKN